MRIFVSVLILRLCLGLSSLPSGTNATDGQNQADILKLLGELPPETMKKVEALGKILQQDLKEGKLTEAQLHEELTVRYSRTEAAGPQSRSRPSAR